MLNRELRQEALRERLLRISLFAFEAERRPDRWQGFAYEQIRTMLR